jgi:hypothetical protein
MAELRNSTFLDYSSYGMTDATSVEQAYGITDQEKAKGVINVALVLPRANDPTSLLESDWGTRQTELAALAGSGTLWTTYGASDSDYQAVLAGLAGMGIPTIGNANGSDGYVTSAESRTIWVSLTPDRFKQLFGQELEYSPSQAMLYWHGSLSLPDGWPVDGLWLDTAPWFGHYPAQSNLAGDTRPWIPPEGAQTIGNALAEAVTQTNLSSQNISDWFYQFPLAGQDVATAAVGLLEPGIGDAIQKDSDFTFQEGLTAFLAQMGSSALGSYYNVAYNGQDYEHFNSIERSLDVGVVASANPLGTFGLYAGSGSQGRANANDFTAFQSAFWDSVYAPPVVSSSYGIFQQSSPDSPFAIAVRELFTDAALRNISTVLANNDWGSGYNFGNGLANQNPNFSSPYAVLVGGTSLTTLAAAPKDDTVARLPTPSQSLYAQARANDRSTLWRLIRGGLRTLPANATDPDQVALLESVWNVYAYQDKTLAPGFGLAVGGASDGGVDTTQKTPWYQAAFDLAPTSANPSGGTGRGAPDVAALAGGNMMYWGPPNDMSPSGLFYYWGTSASTPLWASLAAQIDTIFIDQGLPPLGFMNDLLYTAAAIQPASFNDITEGSNTSSFYYGGDINAGPGYENVTLTGYGYEARDGYDLTTGLGSPNGSVLARTLSAIGHSQIYFGAVPDVLDEQGDSAARQTLLIQTVSPGAALIGFTGGTQSQSILSAPSASFAWDSGTAGRADQSSFAPELATLFDGQGQGTVGQATLATGDAVAVTINGESAHAIRSALTSSFGFVDFRQGSGPDSPVVRLARPVAVAETALGQDDQTAIVRLRQDGMGDLSLLFYRTDDFEGSIGGLKPGDAGYAAAAEARAYQTSAGGSQVDGPGYGNYGQALLEGVDAGDIVAMKLTDQSQGHDYWAFAQANELVNGQNVGHLWNYGLNTWGWEDGFGGGDRDFTDLVVSLDFTSTAGSGYLAKG